MSDVINPEVEIVSEPKYAGPKYHDDAPFHDPVVRCYSCGKISLTETWKRLGKCSKCENRRMRNILSMSDEEVIICRNWNIDPDFMALFERIPDAKY